MQTHVSARENVMVACFVFVILRGWISAAPPLVGTQLAHKLAPVGARLSPKSYRCPVWDIVTQRWVYVSQCSFWVVLVGDLCCVVDGDGRDEVDTVR